MAFGTELGLLALFGFLVLGPKRMHEVLQHIARMKREFQQTSHDVQSRLAAELEMKTEVQD
jgi:Sec-independent protein translocase protein TatA